MSIVTTIGLPNKLISYTDRPTVKIIIKNDGKYLLLNNGLLPGGGIDKGESDSEAIARELQEELGVTVKNIQSLGAVIQYRNFLSKRYVVNGYTAELISISGVTKPQDEGEAQFVYQWLVKNEAIRLVERSIELAKKKPMDSDRTQGKLFNLQTTQALLKSLE